MLDNMRLYGHYEEKELPFCDNCGDEVCVGLDEAYILEDEYFCCAECLVEKIGGKAI